MSGIIGVSPNMKSGVVGEYPAGHVIQTVSSIYDSGGQQIFPPHLLIFKLQVYF